jgi:hypothetical protein
MEKKAKIFTIIYVSLVIVLGVVPLFLPPTISDFSHIDWKGRDLSADIYENTEYLNNTFTQFNETDHLYFYSVSGMSYEEKVAITTLQGLVNKDNTSLFIEIQSYDNFWFERIVDYNNLSVTNISSLTFWNVISKFNASIKGLAIYDENLIDTVNVATFLASLDECVVITNEMKANFSTYAGITEVKHDLRGKFTNYIELYEWAWNNYKDQANKKALFNIDTKNAHMRDYIIASKSFAMWLTPGPFGPKDEIMLFRRILSESPVNIPVWGWIKEGAPGEYEGTRTISHAGKYLLVSSWSNPTVYSAFHIPQFKQKVVSFNASEFQIKNKIYFTVVVSDGDNLNYCMKTLKKIWEDDKRGEVPVGLTVSPLFYKLNPAVLKYFYENATDNDYFVCATSGGGYTYPGMNPEIVEFLSHTKPLLDWCDMRQIWINNGYEAFEPYVSDEVLNAYASEKLNLSGIYINYHDFQVEQNKLVNGVPAFYSLFVEQKNEVIGKLKSIELTNQHLKQPLFVYIAYNSWNFHYSELSEMMDELDPNIYEILRPDHFSEVFKRYEQEKPKSLLNELSIFLIAGLIPLVSSVALLSFIWVKEIKKNRNEIVDKKIEKPLSEPVNSKNPKNRRVIAEKYPKLVLNLLYLFADVTFLFAIKICLFRYFLKKR